MKIIILLIISFFSINNVYAKETVNFDSCVDGDTFHAIINGEKRTIRMIAIDTPESVHPTKEDEYYGEESSEYTCNKIKNANKIEIEYDDNSEKVDKYDRIIAWVFIDDILLQKDLVANGYAKVAYLYGDYKYAHILEESQQLASLNKLGIWKDEQEQNNYSQKDIIIIIILIMIIIFSSNKVLTKKAKKKLKAYLKR